MEVHMLKNYSDPLRVGKQLDLIGSAECQVYGECNLRNLSLLVTYNPSWITCNYIHVPEFGRYYTVSDVLIKNGSQMVISGACDVLETYKEEILSMSGIVKRQSDVANYYLNDDQLQTTSQKQVVTKLMPNQPLTNQRDKFILKVLGG